MNVKLSPLAIILAASLTACGGGGGSSSDSSSAEPTLAPTVEPTPTAEPIPTVTPTPAPVATPEPNTNQSVNVTVIDDYLSNALVWLDLNGNFEFDTGEPSTRTSDSGTGTINYSEQYDIQDYHIVAKAIAGETKDMRTGEPVARTYYLTTPKGKTLVTPLTSLTQGYIEQGEELTQAIAKVCERLSQTDCDVFKDYVADRDDVQLGYARAFMNVMPGAANEINFALTLDQSMVIDNALDQWFTDNQVDPESVNWDLLSFMLDEAGALNISNAYTTDHIANQDIAVSIASGFLESIAAGSVEKGLTRNSYDYSGPCAISGTSASSKTVTEVDEFNGIITANEEILDCKSDMLEEGLKNTLVSTYQGSYQLDTYGDLLDYKGDYFQIHYGESSMVDLPLVYHAQGKSSASYDPATNAYAVTAEGRVKLNVKGVNFVYAIVPSQTELSYSTVDNAFTQGKMVVSSNGDLIQFDIDQRGWWTEVNGQPSLVIEHPTY